VHEDGNIMVRRFAVLTLVLGMAFSLLGAPASGQEAPGGQACAGLDTANGFSDVAAGNTHAAAIACAAELGIVTGTSATTFDPAGDLQRGQAASLIARTLGELGITLPPVEAGPVFSDAGTTHGTNIRRLAAAGIVLGYDDGTFRPGDTLVREQFASVVVRVLSYIRNADVTAGTPAGFEDVATAGTHAVAVDAAVAEGLLQGRSDTEFAPQAVTRRDQTASVLIRLLDRADADVVGEVWSLDQGTDLIHVFNASSNERIVEIDVSPTALADAGFDAAPTGPITVPHMIEFDSRERYAFVASTAGGVTIVIDTAAKEVVEVLPTGAGTHMAAVTPDDSAVWVAAIGAQRMVEIPLDLGQDEPRFAIGRSLDVGELLEPIEEANDWTYPSYGAVCHQFTPDSSEAWVTLGPGWNQGGFFVLDLESGTATHGWDPEVVKANCGVSVTGEQVLANWSGAVVGPGEDTNGEWYVFDTDSKDLLRTEDARGFDAHGLRLTPDGSAYWQVNRISDNALVIDADSLEVIAEYEDFADTPDIIDYSPDGSLIYVSQRGPAPRSGGVHAAAGSEPGVAVIDTATGDRVAFLGTDTIEEEPSADHPDGRILNDVHGLGVRTRGIDAPPLETASIQLASTASVAREVRPAVVTTPDAVFGCHLPGA
jgi:DNA-binding beta-propeller fold protein YncE